MVGKSEPEYYIQLCAQKYAQITENIAASSSAGEIAEMKHKLAIIKEAALEEAKAERRCRMWKLPEFLKVIVDRGGALEKSIPRADALSLIDFSPFRQWAHWACYRAHSSTILPTCAKAGLARRICAIMKRPA